MINIKRITAIVITALIFTNMQIILGNNEFIINPGDEGYAESGEGFRDSNIANYDGSTTRYASSDGAYVTWSAQLPAGTYETFVYKLAHETSDNQAILTVIHADGENKETLDYSTGQSEWVSLGQYKFSDKPAQVKLERTTNILRAGAVRFLLAGTSSSLGKPAVVQGAVETPNVQPNFDEEVIISPLKEGYSEEPALRESSLLDFDGGITRYTTDAGSKAIFEKRLTKGMYGVYVYKIAHETSDTNAPIEIHHESGVESITLDLKTPPADWVFAGAYNFGAETAKVVMNKGAANLRVGSVKFVPYFSSVSQWIMPGMATDIADSNYKTEIIAVSGLGIMESQGEFYPLEPITRGDMMYSITRLHGVDLLEPEEGIFSDVPVSHKYAREINTAYVMGIVKGRGDGTFAPDENISTIDAIRLIHSLLGYGRYINVVGDNFIEQMTLATRIGILKGLGDDFTGNLTRERLAKLIYNALDCEMLGFSAIGDGETYNTLKGHTLLREKLGLYRVKGIMSENKYSSRTAYSTLTGESVRVDDQVYQSNTDVSYLLGYNTEMYVSTGDAHVDGAIVPEDVIVFAMPAAQNREIELKHTQILDSTTASVVYYKNDNGNDGKAEISAQGAYIYNGVGVFNMPDQDMKPNAGSIKLIDNNSDGVYDYVFVIDAIDRVVSGVSATENDKGKVFFKYAPSEMGFLDFGDKNNEIIVYNNRATGSIADIKAGRTVSIAASRANGGKRLYSLYLSSKSVSGFISETTEIDGRTMALIESVYYPYGQGYLSYTGVEKADIGQQATFYIDWFGNIANITIDSAVSEYAYLVSAAESTGIAQRWTFRMYTDTKRLTDVTAAAKFRINDTIVTESNKYTLLAPVYDKEQQKTINQLIKIRLNSAGELIELKTAKESDTILDGEFYSLSGINTTIYRAGNQKSFNTQYKTKASTKVFVVPTDTRIEDKLIYDIKDMNYFNSSGTYTNMKFYNVDREFNIPIIVYTRDVVEMDKRNAPIAVISNSTTGLNQDNELIPFLHLVNMDGTTIRAEVVEPGLVGFNRPDRTGTEVRGMLVEELKRGDVIQYFINADSKLVSFRLLQRFDDTVKNEGFIGGSTSDTNVYADLYVALGQTTMVGTDGMYLEMSHLESPLTIKGRIWPLLASIPTLRVKKDSQIVVSKSAVAEIMPNDWVFVHAVNDAVRGYIIFEK